MANEMKDRIYVSSGFETTAGVQATLNKSFWPISCNLGVEFNDTLDDNVNGYDGPVGITRENYMASGDITCDLNPEFASWAFKMFFGASPSSGTVSPSSTVYEHAWTAIQNTPKTWTFMKTKGDITNWTESWGGNVVTRLSFKGNKGRIQLTVGVQGMAGDYSRGDASPGTAVVTSGEGYLTGIKSELYVDGTVIADGILFTDWSLDIETGKGVLDTAGSSDGSHTAADTVGRREATLTFRLKESAVTNLDELIAGTDFNTYELKMWGPTIDSGNSLQSLVSVKFDRARLSGRVNSDIGGKGVVAMQYTVKALVSTSTGYDVTAKTRNLQTSY